MLKISLLLMIGAGFTAPAFAAAPQVGQAGWVDQDHRTLYVFDKDTVPGKSACHGECAAIWPPALANADDKAEGDWSFVNTGDGKMQWAYKDHPLYTFIKDEKAGDARGDGVKGVWHIAKP